MACRMQRRPSPPRGQGLIEYVLVLIMAMGIAVMIERTSKQGIRRLWYSMAGDIAAPCPVGAGCVKPEAIPDP